MPYQPRLHGPSPSITAPTDEFVRRAKEQIAHLLQHGTDASVQEEAEAFLKRLAHLESVAAQSDAATIDLLNEALWLGVDMVRLSLRDTLGHNRARRVGGQRGGQQKRETLGDAREKARDKLIGEAVPFRRRHPNDDSWVLAGKMLRKSLQRKPTQQEQDKLRQKLKRVWIFLDVEASPPK